MMCVALFPRVRLLFVVGTFYSLLSSFSAFGQDLVIFFSDNSSEEIELNEISKLSMEGNFLLVSLNSGSNDTYVIGNVDHYSFDETTSLPDAASSIVSDVILFPNPVRQSFSVSFSLLESTDLKLRLIDLRGREVWVFQNDFLPAGQHQIELNLPDFSHGRYLFQLNVQNHSVTKPITIVKN